MSTSQGGDTYKKDPGDLCLGERQCLAQGGDAVMGLGGWCLVTTKSWTKSSLSALLPSNSWRAEHPEPRSYQEARVTGGAVPEGRTGSQSCECVMVAKGKEPRNARDR